MNPTKQRHAETLSPTAAAVGFVTGVAPTTGAAGGATLCPICGTALTTDDSGLPSCPQHSALEILEAMENASGLLEIAGETPDPETAETVPAILDYYDAAKKEYLVQNSERNWIGYSESQYKRILKGRGVRSKVQENERLSQVDQTILEAQDTRSLVYAGQLADWPAGVHEHDTGRFLVTRGPRLIEPESGDWSNLKTFFETLLSSDSAQFPVFLGWMKIAYESLRAGAYRPGQALTLAGEHDTGKSVAQILITEMLGGRRARPYQFLSGRTEFNKDLFEAEHLTVEDDVPSSTLSDRRNFGAKIKETTANEGQRLHAKNRDALLLPVFWRLSITVNDEPENLMILPPIDEILSDKIVLFKAVKAKLPCETENHAGRKRCMDIFKAELSAMRPADCCRSIRLAACTWPDWQQSTPTDTNATTPGPGTRGPHQSTPTSKTGKV